MTADVSGVLAPASSVGMTKPRYPDPLTRRLKAAGLGTLAEEEQARIAAEVKQLEALGHADVAELVRERTAHQAS